MSESVVSRGGRGSTSPTTPAPPAPPRRNGRQCMTLHIQAAEGSRALTQQPVFPPLCYSPAHLFWLLDFSPGGQHASTHTQRAENKRALRETHRCHRRRRCHHRSVGHARSAKVGHGGRRGRGGAIVDRGGRVDHGGRRRGTRGGGRRGRRHCERQGGRENSHAGSRLSVDIRAERVRVLGLRTRAPYLHQSPVEIQQQSLY